MHPSQLLVAIGILALVAFLMVCMYVDLDRLRREVELDELWDDEVDGGRASSGEFVATALGIAPATVDHRRRRAGTPA